MSYDYDADEAREWEQQERRSLDRLALTAWPSVVPLRVDDEDNRCGVCNRRSRFDICKSCVRDEREAFPGARDHYGV